MYLSLYRKWRPQTFDEMCGQDHITAILRRQCAENRVSHAYLFCGTRGTGKTSTAKILAKAVNCENPIGGNPCNKCASCKSIDNGSATDVLEMDAASNNGINDVRDLRDEIVYPPTVLKKRVYIIDEVHMLSQAAFNALLKTLEEPPEYIVFVLATTELNALPPTIISRCIRFDFSRIDEEAIRNRLDFVAKSEQIEAESDALDLLARLADGSMRDALSLLEACSNGTEGTITCDGIRNILGLAGEDTVYGYLSAAADSDTVKALDIVSEVHRSSKDIGVFIDDLAVAVRDILIEKQLKRFGRPSRLNNPRITKLVESITGEKLFYISSVLEETQSRISKYTLNKRQVLELATIRLCDQALSDSVKALAARVAELEKKIAVMSVVGAPIVSAPVAEPQAKPSVADKPAPSESVSAPCESKRAAFTLLPELFEALFTSPEITAFIEKSTVTTDGTTVYFSGNAITVQMLSLGDNERIISDAVALVTGRIHKIVFETVTEVKLDENQVSLIDEL